MGILGTVLDPLNLFSDPSLRQRQDVLDSQWVSLKSSYQTCDQTPDSSFSEFTTDFGNWKEFYNSQSDWATDAFNATNRWQETANSWSDRIKSWGCNGNFTQSDGSPTTLNGGVPGVKSVPQDQESLLQQAGEGLSNVGGGFFDWLKTAGWVVTGLIVIILIGVVYTVTHAKVSTPTGGLG